MKSARIRLYTPADWFGRAICWRLESRFCHAAIELDDVIYSATYPRILMLPDQQADVGQPPRGGAVFEIALTDKQFDAVRYWCRSRVGSEYDWLSMVGWFLRIQSLQLRRHMYCFEFVFGALSAAGLVPQSKQLITGDELLVHLLEQGAKQLPLQGGYPQC